MVLIVGLINMTGVAQTPAVEAQTSPRLTGLTVTHNLSTGADTSYKDVALRGGSSTGFSPTRMSYTGMVENGVGTVRVAPVFDYDEQIVVISVSGIDADSTVHSEYASDTTPSFSFGDVGSRTVTGYGVR